MPQEHHISKNKADELQMEDGGQPVRAQGRQHYQSQG